jgi:hypothetical protein
VGRLAWHELASDVRRLRDHGYSFRAAGWALILALIGTVVLCFAPGVRGVWPISSMTSESVPRGPRQKSWLWCFGASLQRVLPLIASRRFARDSSLEVKRGEER